MRYDKIWYEFKEYLLNVPDNYVLEPKRLVEQMDRLEISSHKETNKTIFDIMSNKSEKG